MILYMYNLETYSTYIRTSFVIGANHMLRAERLSWMFMNDGFEVVWGNCVPRTVDAYNPEGDESYHDSYGIAFWERHPNGK